jgi:hypothetical protein
MIDALPLSTPPSPHALETALRRRIGWICQITRVSAVIYALWLLYSLVTYWSIVERIDAGHGRMLNKDLSQIEPWQQVWAFALQFGNWLLAAYVAYSAWRLFTLYLDGRIFTLDSAVWLRRIALFGVIAQTLDIVTRPVLSVLLTLHFPAGQNLRLISVYLVPNDLALLVLLFGLLALAHIQKTAAEIVDDTAQIIGCPSL